MKNTITLLFLVFATCTFAQTKPTQSIRIEGAVTAPTTINLSDLQKMEAVPIADLTITNHRGETKKTLDHLKGIPVKALLEAVTLEVDSPKYLSEFYFIFEASDGYKVVFSWNELFNTETGNHTYLVTEKDGKQLNNMDDALLLITTSDFKTGRRHVKFLHKIIVKRVL